MINSIAHPLLDRPRPARDADPATGHQPGGGPAAAPHSDPAESLGREQVE
ncbi:hypothetical protein [Nesterenkonia jeotgali]|uniref:Uncharacterized protein n=1 Tax=Nesterenkonia jeotgali TaxID=317018 RepID=A0A839FNI9_9MICC|nr:hypothetical protein [Nesterenkonia jeotgali]MBA8920221.1 hypothetical protein [Nesterenkonia jeotgali]